MTCAMLVSLAQPLAALAALSDCASCGHDELDSTCCCAPEEPATPLAPAAEESCCSVPADEPSDTEYAPQHECSCKSVPECPTVPVQLPPVQDIAAASAPSRLVAAGCAISMHTGQSLGGLQAPPGVPGGVSPPRIEIQKGTSLGRAAARGTSAFLAFLSVARI